MLNIVSLHIFMNVGIRLILLTWIIIGIIMIIYIILYFAILRKYKFLREIFG